MGQIISNYALSLPNVYMTEQWGGAHVFKVGTPDTFKMFAILRPGAMRLTVKAPTAETYKMLLEVGVAEQHSHLKRGNWMVLFTDKLESEDVLERIGDSYDTVFLSLPKRVREPLMSAAKKG